jgi:putative copper resistance protein D
VIAHIVNGPVPPKFSPGALADQWSFDPFVLVLVGAAGLLYWMGLRRLRNGPPFPASRPAAFYSGLAVVLVALVSPIDTYAGVSFSDHMIQHSLLTLLAAPLVALGAPVTLALRTVSASARKRFLIPALHSRVARLLSHPVFAWSLFAVVQYVTHFTPFYNAALESDGIHSLEHALFLTAGLVFWWPVVGLDPSPRRFSHPARLLYLVLAMPLEAFLGVAIMSADTPLYSHYGTLPPPWGGQAALLDQGNAGSIMWIAGELTVLIAGLLVAGAWMRHTEARQRRIEAEMDRAAGLPSGLRT